MIFIIGARGTGKTTMLSTMLNSNPRGILVSEFKNLKANIKTILPGEALDAILIYGVVLERGISIPSYDLYFEEPCNYWATFLQILALADPKTLKAAAFTPVTKQQSTLERVNPNLIDKVLRLSWEEPPKCQKR